MTKQEIKTITEAMAVKQTWIRKELDDFLELWAEMTQEKISGHDKFVLYEYDGDNGNGSSRLTLVRGKPEVDGDTMDGYGGWNNWDGYLCLENQSIRRIRKIINHIDSGLVKYFKDIQADISEIDQTGMKIRNIIEKLK